LVISAVSEGSVGHIRLCLWMMVLPSF
jgi:hypothetical protein